MVIINNYVMQSRALLEYNFIKMFIKLTFYSNKLLFGWFFHNYSNNCQLFCLSKHGYCLLVGNLKHAHIKKYSWHYILYYTINLFTVVRLQFYLNNNLDKIWLNSVVTLLLSHNIGHGSAQLWIFTITNKKFILVLDFQQF